MLLLFLLVLFTLIISLLGPKNATKKDDAQPWFQPAPCTPKTGEMVLFQPWIRQEDQRMPQKMLLNGTAKAIATGTKHSLILMEARIFLWVYPSRS